MTLAVPASPPSSAAPEVIRHAYLHVPFCPSICPYCDFHVLERRAGQVEAYLERLEREAAEQARQWSHDLQTVYLGGGTPSFLRDGELTRLVETVSTHLGWGVAENTLEVNPGTVTPERARLWRELGFDRASVGVQSLHDPTLRFLGRQHSAEQGRAAVSMLLDAGFRVSGDLITAVPGQPLEADVRALVALGVEHVSAYTLTVEEGTPFARKGVVVDEDDERAGFEVTGALLSQAGLARYEVSNYARPGAESRHNTAYWTSQYFLGLGPGAVGSYPAAGGAPPFRRTNPHLHRWLAGEPGERDDLTPEDRATDALFMGLRLRAGVDLSDLSARCGLDLRARYADVMAEQVRRGLLTLDGDRLRATPEGWWVLNRVVGAFMEEDRGA